MTWMSHLIDEPAVLWTPPIRDGLGGYTWELPSEVLSRWQYGLGLQDGPKVRYLAEGSTEVARTVVWLETLVEPGSYLYKGTLLDLKNELPETDSNQDEMIFDLAAQVVSVVNIRSVNGNYYLYKAFLDED